MKFNAGRRFSEVMLHLNWTVAEAAEKFGVAVDTIYYWKKRVKFADSILEQLIILKKEGINPDYFELPDAPMLLESNKTETSNVSAETQAVLQRLKNTEEELRQTKESLKIIESGLRTILSMIMEVFEKQDEFFQIALKKLKDKSKAKA